MSVTQPDARWDNCVLTKVSNPDKLLFPTDGITKGEVVSYYESAAERMLHHLIDRPLTLERYPQGIEQPGFMQKHAGKGFPGFIERVELPKQGGTVAYPSISDVEGLLYLANQNTITFHIPCFRTNELPYPDRLVFDLDPVAGDESGGRFAAREVADFLVELAVAAQVMTSGSKGFHVVVPLAPTIDFDTLGRFAQAFAVLLTRRHPERLTVEFLKKERQGRVFVDWLRNHFGATGVSPYSLRPRPGAPIAMPIAWEELGGVAPDQFTLADAAERLAENPWQDTAPQDLTQAVATIASMLEEHEIDLPAFDRFGR